MQLLHFLELERQVQMQLLRGLCIMQEISRVPLTLVLHLLRIAMGDLPLPFPPATV